MVKNSDKKIWDRPVEESEPNPIYQGGYTDGYEAGEQHGCITCRNDAFEAAARKVEGTLIRKDITDAIAVMLRGMKEEVPNGG